MSRLSSRLQLQWMLVGQLARDLFRRRGSTTDPKRILIAHHLLLGDTLMLAALLAKLRANHPHAEIVMCCPEAIVPLYARHPWGISALPYDPRDRASLLALHRVARAGDGFDLAVLPADNRMSWLARALGARHIVAFEGDRPAYKNWFVDEARPWPGEPTALPETFAALVDGKEPPLYQPEQWPLDDGAPFAPPTAPYAVLHLGASSRLKLWPAERWRALAEWLLGQGVTPVWSAGPRETALVTEADPESRFASYAGRLDLLQMAHLLRDARLLVSPDTGIAHLGRVTGTPSVTLYGPGSTVLCDGGRFFSAMPGRSLSEEIECRNQHTLFKREVIWVQRCGRGFGPGADQCETGRCSRAIALSSVQDACQKELQRTSGYDTVMDTRQPDREDR